MLTKEQIQDLLREDPNWTPGDDATQEEWDLYEVVVDEMAEGGEAGADLDEEDDDDFDLGGYSDLSGTPQDDDGDDDSDDY